MTDILDELRDAAGMLWLAPGGHQHATDTMYAAITEIEKLRKALKPVMFWDAEDGENVAYSAEDIVANYAYGEIVKIEQAAHVPTVYGFSRQYGRGHSYFFGTREECEQALAANAAHLFLRHIGSTT